MLSFSCRIFFFQGEGEKNKVILVGGANTWLGSVCLKPERGLEGHFVTSQSAAFQNHTYWKKIHRVVNK